MVRAFTQQLAEWADDPAVTRVIVTAAGERAFSAGGDIRALYDLGRRRAACRDARRSGARNTSSTPCIKRYPKPYVSLIDGIVMGGGVGISVHGSHRVAGDRFLFAMPEVGIGFFPDVGATWFLPRLPGELGAYCALTGERLATRPTASPATIATHRVPSARFPELADALCGAVSVDATLGAFAEPVRRRADRGAARPRSTGCSRPTASRTSSPRSTARRPPKARMRASPRATRRHDPHQVADQASSLRCAGARRHGAWPFDACMQTEFRIVSRIIHGHDFYEGVRAVIVDKDNAPRWQPATLAEVTDADVERHFAPLGRDELVLP